MSETEGLTAPHSLEDAWQIGLPIGELFNLFGFLEGKPERKERSPDGPSSGCLGFPEYEYRGQEELRARLKSGVWIAIGYSAPRSPNAPLEILPPDFIDEADIDYAHSGFSGDGYKFVGVRIIGRSDLPTQISATPIRGRPSIQPALQDACRRLLRDGALSTNDPVSVVSARVWAFLESGSSSLPRLEKRPSDETIRKAWRDVLDSKKQ